MTKIFRPANGWEGAAFQERWCDRCKRDAAAREGDLGEGCEILAATLAFLPHEDGYPSEWTYSDAGAPVCKAFEPDPSAVLD